MNDPSICSYRPTLLHLTTGRLVGRLFWSDLADLDKFGIVVVIGLEGERLDFGIEVVSGGVVSVNDVPQDISMSDDCGETFSMIRPHRSGALTYRQSRLPASL